MPVTARPAMAGLCQGRPAIARHTELASRPQAATLCLPAPYRQAHFRKRRATLPAQGLKVDTVEAS
jgi:hypothetical protein